MPDTCFLCGNKTHQTLVSMQGLKVLQCRDCGIGFQETFTKNPLRFYESENYYNAWWKNKQAEEASVRNLKKKTAEWVLNRMAAFVSPGARVFEVGCAFGYFLEMAETKGYQCFGLDVSESVCEAMRAGFQVYRTCLEELDLGEESFDAVVMLDVLEHLSNPRACLKKIRRLLRPRKGILVLITPDAGSMVQKIMRSRWHHFKPEHLYYYSKKGIRRFLQQYDFQILELTCAFKATSLRYVAACSETYRNLPDFLSGFLRRLPGASAPFLLPSELFCIAKVNAL